MGNTHRSIVIKICQAIFSTNRIPYLQRTLASQRILNFSGCTVDKIFIDDYPRGRNDVELLALVNSFGYHEVYLHDTNRGIGATWRHFWDLVHPRSYDFIWQQEDDVELLESVSIRALIDVLRAVPQASQVVLKRQAWYPHETEASPLDTDIIVGDFRGEFNSLASVYFTPIASLYPADRVAFDYYGFYRERYPHEPIFLNTNLNEALIGKALLEELGLRSLHIKNRFGLNLINHIGDYTIGRKLLPGEPGFAGSGFERLDPTIRYCSRTGQPYSGQAA